VRLGNYVGHSDKIANKIILSKRCKGHPFPQTNTTLATSGNND
jgi:hypothetical protein